MNERIRELLKQSTNPPWDGEQGPMNEFNLERFAESIVRECADLYKNEDGRPWFDKFQYKEVLKIYSKQIKQHFGVEE